MKMNFKIVIGKKFIDQHFPSCNQAIPHEGHQVAMVDPANNLDFGLELPVALATAGLEAFHGNLFAIRQHTLVDVPKTTLTQQVGLCEPSRRHQQLIISEGALVES